MHANISFQQYRRLFFDYLGPLWPRVGLVAALLFTSIGVQLLTPQILRQFIDAAQQGSALGTLYGAALFFLGAGLLGRIVDLLALYASGDVGWRATNRLRCDLALHALRLDLSFHDARTPGELIERIDGDVSRLANFFSRFAIRLLGGALLAGGVVLALAREDARLGLALGFFACLYLLAHMRSQRLAAPFWRAESQTRADLSGFVGERLSGIEDTRTCGAVPHAMRRFFETMRRHFWAYCKAEIATDVGWTLSNIVFALGFAAALALGAWLYGSGAITVGTVYLIVHYLQMLRAPLNAISGEVEDLQKIRVSVERIQELLSAQSVSQEETGASLPTGALAVELHELSFAYHPEKQVLDRLSLHLQEGHVLGLLGRTGSGKTTLSRLLVRLYEPEPGQIRLGSAELCQIPLAELRQRVGLVTQEVQLFRASLRENVRLFDERIDDEQIEESLHLLGLEKWYRSLPGGLDTELEAGGSGLSAGEAQLLACARAFLKDPGLVVLDEASSRLDPATERLLEAAMQRLLRGRTGIVIAHRLSTVQRVDEIAIIEEGKFSERGPRQALAADPHSQFSRLLRSGMEEVLA